jgi:lipopolysaccharide assembly protein A
VTDTSTDTTAVERDAQPEEPDVVRTVAAPPEAVTGPATTNGTAPATTNGTASPVVSPTRISATWVGILVGASVLTLLLVFILQNTKSVKVSFLSANGHIPLGVALIFAALGGVLLAAVAASLRILQVRRRLGGDSGSSTAPPPATSVGEEP